MWNAGNDNLLKIISIRLGRCCVRVFKTDQFITASATPWHSGGFWSGDEDRTRFDLLVLKGERMFKYRCHRLLSSPVGAVEFITRCINRTHLCVTFWWNWLCFWSNFTKCQPEESGQDYRRKKCTRLIQSSCRCCCTI